MQHSLSPDIMFVNVARPSRSFFCLGIVAPPFACLRYISTYNITKELTSEMNEQLKHQMSSCIILLSEHELILNNSFAALQFA
ncbi:hypothetical protein ACLKA6_003816 [Drosophila palustris]